MATPNHDRRTGFAPQTRAANLIIAGTGKSGTTSLFHYLGQHPDVCASSTKETRYFSPLRAGRTPGPLSEYERFFAHCKGERYRLDASPDYCIGGPALIQAIKDLPQAPRVILTLREPVERLWSNFWYLKSKRRTSRTNSFAAYVDWCIEVRESGRDRLVEHNKSFWLQGFYGEFVGDWLAAFGDDLRVVFFEHLIAAPVETVQQLCEWLGLDPGPATKFDFGRENPTLMPRSEGVTGLAIAVNRVSSSTLKKRPFLYERLKRAYYGLNGRRAEQVMDDGSRQKLETLFHASNQELAAQLTASGYRDLPGWLQTAGQLD